MLQFRSKSDPSFALTPLPRIWNKISIIIFFFAVNAAAQTSGSPENPGVGSGTCSNVACPAGESCQPPTPSCPGGVAMICPGSCPTSPPPPVSQQCGGYKLQMDYDSSIANVPNMSNGQQYLTGNLVKMYTDIPADYDIPSCMRNLLMDTASDLATAGEHGGIHGTLVTGNFTNPQATYIEAAHGTRDYFHCMQHAPTSPFAYQNRCREGATAPGSTWPTEIVNLYNSLPNCAPLGSINTNDQSCRFYFLGNGDFWPTAYGAGGPSQPIRYLDANCNPTNTPPSGSLCTLGVKYWASPISLIWNGGSELPAAKLVSFRTGLSPKKEAVLWRASGDAPLLVYDPGKSGRVSGPEQLFGTWTFGGQRTASLSKNSTASAVPWKNGYEPLATLDHDGNGEISGSELDPVAVWFDHNRDAEVQDGELKRASEVLITKIFTSPNSKQEDPSMVRASKGFIRINFSGEKVVGQSIDWFTLSAPNSNDLLARLLTNDLGEEKSVTETINAVKSQVQKKDSDSTATAITKVTEASDQYLGLWKWQATGTDFKRKDPSAKLPSGYLLLAKNRKGELEGLSIVGFKHDEYENVWGFSVTDLKGKVAHDVAGNDVLDFQLVDKDINDKPIVMGRSKGYLVSADTLEGHTDASGQLGVAKNLSFQYSWKATKVTKKNQE